MHAPPIIYLGDTQLDAAACYLAGLLHAFGCDFDYVPSNRAPDAAAFRAPRKLFILSDYPASLLSQEAQRSLLDQVERGAGLLMIGGWESFHGAGGDWHRSLVASALPVEVAHSDDRINCDQPALVTLACEHAITANLPWNERPPGVGGFNDFKAREHAQVLLNLQRFRVRHSESGWNFEASSSTPLLVVGAHGLGRCTALATDLAPHWVGGLVDWGPERFKAKHPQSQDIEVGNLYAQLVRQLVYWTGNL
jgi:hypothetical protein